jgi:hypothetical protein
MTLHPCYRSQAAEPYYQPERTRRLFVYPLFCPAPLASYLSCLIPDPQNLIAPTLQGTAPPRHLPRPPGPRRPHPRDRRWRTGGTRPQGLELLVSTALVGSSGDIPDKLDSASVNSISSLLGQHSVIHTM